MKKISLLFILLLGSIHVVLAQLKSQVNECFELTSIVFRLAGADEYTNSRLSAYTNQIDRYFETNKKHKLISYIKEIREKQRIGYDAIPVASGFLEIRNGKISIRPDLKISQISEMDKRWTEQSFKTFVSLLNDFYRKTKFRTFFNQQADLYRIAEKRMNNLLENFNINWFKTIFGEDIVSPMVVISPNNGSSNYAFHIPAKDKINGMVIGCGVDKEGLPYYGSSMMMLIVHEFLHNYTNRRISDYWNQIDSASQVMYMPIKEDMRKNAYEGARTTMNEWFTNLITIMYLRDNPIEGLPLKAVIRNYQKRGFIWMNRSVVFMEHFLNNRKRFATLDDYMPQIVGFIKNIAANFDQVLNEYANRHPYVTDVFPAPGIPVSMDIDSLVFRFSEPMLGAHGMRGIDDKNIQSVPFAVTPFWKDKNNLVFIVVLDKSRLEKGKTYGFRLDHKFFQSAKTYPMKEDYTYTFQISEE